MKSYTLKQEYNINKINEVGILKFRINIHSAANYSLTLGDPKFLEIYYLLDVGLWHLYSQYILFVIMSASVKIFLKRLCSNFR